MKTLTLPKSLLISLLQFFLALCFLVIAISCEKEEVSTDEQSQEDVIDNSNDEESNDNMDTDNLDENADSGNQTNDCPESTGFVFEEVNGIVSIEFEDNDFPEGWVLKNDASDISGDGYLQWEGNPSMGDPGNGMVTFPVRITTTGTYRFLWKSSYRKGNNGTEHNDSWLRFPDADDFFGRKGDGSSVVYPNGSGKTPNPNGRSADGWFKIYRSGNDNAFKWQSSTSDHDAHDIFVTFSAPGLYLLEVSARSDFHAIDRLLLFEENMNQNDAIDAADTFSQKVNCN